MKRVLGEMASLFLVILILLGSVPSVMAAGSEDTASKATILFTHDTHSHFLPTESENGEYGGYTRLATLLKEQRAAAGCPTITLDGGDFSMGTLFQTIYTSEAAELRTLGAMDYDVVTIGNHEFDFRGTGFASMLNAAVASGDKLPAIVEANYLPPQEGEEGYDDTAQAVWSALQQYGVTDYVMVEKDGIRFAVFGLMGVDADDCAPMSGMVLEDMQQAAARVVADIQTNEDYDYIIALSHSGTSEKNSASEDYQLAKAVDGIDVIISGHTHTVLTEPMTVNNTLIVSCGAYTANLGALTISKDEDGNVVCDSYKLIPVDETIAEDETISDMVEHFKALVSSEYLSNYGYTFDQVLTTASFDFTPIDEFALTQEEDGLGNLIADGYIYAVRQAEGDDYINVDFAVVNSGVIRSSFSEGEITVSDAFNVSSLGSGADGSPGYPLICVYLYGKEIKDVMEVDASVSPIMTTAQLYGSGMGWAFNTNRMLFDKVTDSWQVLSDGSEAEIEDNRLYRVVTGLYSGQMLGAVNAKSFGILAVIPRDEAGNEITDFESRIIYDAEGNEVKEWYALASYLDSMDAVPLSYAAPEGRKAVYSSWNPVELIKNPRWITIAALFIILLVVAVAVLVIRRIATGGRRRKARNRDGYRPYRGK